MPLRGFVWTGRPLTRKTRPGGKPPWARPSPRGRRRIRRAYAGRRHQSQSPGVDEYGRRTFPWKRRRAPGHRHRGARPRCPGRGPARIIQVGLGGWGSDWAKGAAAGRNSRIVAFVEADPRPGSAPSPRSGSIRPACSPASTRRLRRSRPTASSPCCRRSATRRWPRRGFGRQARPGREAVHLDPWPRRASDRAGLRRRPRAHGQPELPLPRGGADRRRPGGPGHLRPSLSADDRVPPGLAGDRAPLSRHRRAAPARHGDPSFRHGADDLRRGCARASPAGAGTRPTARSAIMPPPMLCSSSRAASSSPITAPGCGAACRPPGAGNGRSSARRASSCSRRGPATWSRRGPDELYPAPGDRQDRGAGRPTRSMAIDRAGSLDRFRRGRSCPAWSRDSFRPAPTTYSSLATSFACMRSSRREKAAELAASTRWSD